MLGDAFSQELRTHVLETPLYGKPPSLQAKTHGVLTWSTATLDVATADAAELVASWIEDDTQLKWLGGDPTDTTRADQVRSWIEEAYGAFVLSYAPTTHDPPPEPRPVAFATLAPLQQESHEVRVELGRILVAPAFRHRGIGTTLANHLSAAASLALSAHAERATIFMRSSATNFHGQEMMARLPYSPHKGPPPTPSTGRDDDRWFEYCLHPNPRTLATVVRTLRKRLRLSQAALAFHCRVRRPTINMIESASRIPSLDLLSSLCLRLGSTEMDRVDLLLSAIGEKPSSSLASHDPLFLDPTTRSASIWILSDYIMELGHSDFLEASIQALEGGYDRWFFLPSDRADKLCSQLRDRFSTPRLPTNVLRRQLRIYEAPPTLCALRVEIRNPAATKADFATIEGSTTIEGNNNRRVPLAAGRVSALTALLYEAASDADFALLRETTSPPQHAASERQHTAYAAFRRRYPEEPIK